MALTGLTVSNAKPKDKDYKLSDGRGLYLLIKKNGSKYWRWSYRFMDKQKTMALGVFPDVTLKDARDLVSHYREVRESGKDPVIVARIDKQEREKDFAHQMGITFGEVIDAWFEYRKKGRNAYDERTIKRNGGIIDNWLKPALGQLPASKVTATEVLTTLKLIEAQKKHSTASKAKAILSMVFSYGIAEPSIPIERNWTLDINGLLEGESTSHYAAMITPKEVGELLKAISVNNSHWLTKLAMRLSMHWFIRPGELRRLKWSNVNWASNMIQIEAKDMKTTATTIDLWVPFSKQAKQMLEFIHKNGRTSEYVFPSVRNLSKPMSENTINSALRSMGFKGKQTAHGLRATARTLLAEELKESVDFVEQQLGHVVRDANGRAYNRTTLIEERSQMLQRWSDYLDDLEYKAVHGLEIKSRYEELIEKQGVVNEQ